MEANKTKNMGLIDNQFGKEGRERQERMNKRERTERERERERER